MSTPTINQLVEMDPLFAQTKIRVHKATQQASVIDVVRMVTGQDQDVAAGTVRRLMKDDTKFRAICTKLRINGKGKPTWVANAPTCVELIWELPGKAAKVFRRNSAHYICRILGGDHSLIDAIEVRFDGTSEETKDLTEEEYQRMRKRKLEGLEIAERELALANGKIDVKNKELVFNQKMKKSISTDVELAVECADKIKNMVLYGGQSKWSGCCVQ